MLYTLGPFNGLFDRIPKLKLFEIMVKTLIFYGFWNLLSPVCNMEDWSRTPRLGGFRREDHSFFKFSFHITFGRGKIGKKATIPPFILLYTSI